MAFSKLVLAGVLAASSFAFAQDNPDMPEGQPPPSAAQEQQRAEAQKEAKVQLDQIYADKNKKDAFKIEGKLEGIDAQTGAIVLKRENLPPALLLLTQQTDVKMNGKSAAVTQLQPGSEIRASFNLAQGIPVAVQIDAKAPKGKEMKKEMDTPTK